MLLCISPSFVKKSIHDILFWNSTVYMQSRLELTGLVFPASINEKCTSEIMYLIIFYTHCTFFCENNYREYMVTDHAIFSFVCLGPFCNPIVCDLLEHLQKFLQISQILISKLAKFSFSFSYLLLSLLPIHCARSLPPPIGALVVELVLRQQCPSPHTYSIARSAAARPLYCTHLLHRRRPTACSVVHSLSREPSRSTSSCQGLTMGRRGRRERVGGI